MIESPVESVSNNQCWISSLQHNCLPHFLFFRSHLLNLAERPLRSTLSVRSGGDLEPDMGYQEPGWIDTLDVPSESMNRASELQRFTD